MATDFTATYDLATPVGQVRIIIFDVDVDTTPPAPSGTTPRADWSALYTDAELTYFLGLHGGASNQINLAAADALEAIASNAALLNKRIKLGDYEQDTTKTAQDLRLQADRLRTQGEDAPAEAFGDVAYTDANYRRMLIANALNNGS